MRQKLFFTFFLSFIGIMNANASAGDAVDWYLYFYSEQYDIDGNVGQFVETETPDVYILENCQVTESTNHGVPRMVGQKVKKVL